MQVQQRQPIARLADAVAVARTRPHPTRLVVRNTEHFGVVHLYFYGGRLIHVQGHRGPGAPSLNDLATWRQAVIREDPLDEVPPADHVGEPLDALLDDVLRQVAPTSSTFSTSSVMVREPVAYARQVSSPSLPQAGERSPYPSFPTAPSGAIVVPQAPPTMSSAEAVLKGASGLPTLERPRRIPAEQHGHEVGTLSGPQWNLLALAMHQMATVAGHDLGNDVAVRFLRQAVANLAPRDRILAALDVDPDGWLAPAREEIVGRAPTRATTDAITRLVAEYEVGCTALLGPVAARRILTESLGPLAQPLAQLGMAIPIE